MVSRNSLFVGLPFFLIGVYIKNKKLVMSTHLAFLCLVIGVLFAFMQVREGMLLTGLGDVYISSIFASVFIFLACVNLQIPISAKAYDKYIGKNLSFEIYLWHVLFGTILNLFIPVNEYIAFTAALLFSYILCQITRLLKKKYKKLSYFF